MLLGQFIVIIYKLIQLNLYLYCSQELPVVIWHMNPRLFSTRDQLFE